MDATEKVLLLTAIGAAISAVVTGIVTARLSEGQTSITDGARPSQNPGSNWTDLQFAPAANAQPNPWVYQGPGRQNTRSSFNGQIYAACWHEGGNANSPVTYEQSCAFQTSTKNPFANGTNNSYARAVNTATRDPTNSVNPLVLGPRVAINNTRR